MMCPMCEAHVNDAVRKIYPKAKVSSSCKNAVTTVTGEGIDPTRVKKTIEETGYTVENFVQSEYKKKGIFALLFRKKGSFR